MGLTKLPRALHHILPTSCDRTYYSCGLTAENEVVKNKKRGKGYGESKGWENYTLTTALWNIKRSLVEI